MRLNVFPGLNLVLFASFAACLVLLGVSSCPAQPVLKPEPGEMWRKLLSAQKIQMSDAPNVQVATHNVGNIQVGHTNLGHFGFGFVGAQEDPTTGEALPSAIFPANSAKNHLYLAALWIGAVVGRDTLVTIGADDGFAVHEWWPGAKDGIVQRSVNPKSRFYDPQALSEQDIIATYYDTLTDVGTTSQDQIDGRPHRPLNLKVEERSLQWSYDYASDFVLFDFSITNIGPRKLEKVYMGVYDCGDMHHLSKVGLDAYGDDICGFKRTMPAECGFEDTINISYVFDNDGDPDGETWNKSISIRSVAGIRLIRTPSDSLEYSFNWWSAAPGPDFGPRKTGTLERPFRDMNGFIGAPHGDRNKYDVMRNQEFDYDQLTGAVDHSGDGWLPPTPVSATLAKGGDPKLLLSFGPFEIFPGETLPITYSFIAGEDFLTNAGNFAKTQNINPRQPELYYNTLDFSDLGINSRWASWIYDNPGVDTDLDGNFGKSRICVLDDSLVIDSTLLIDSSVTPFDTSYLIDSFLLAVRADTLFYEGDGVPDFRGAAPPPAPDVRLSPSVGQIILRWNGFLAETEKDPFSDTTDFEGYRVYASPTLRRDDFTLYASFDKRNYNRYVYSDQKERFVLIDAPFTLEQLKSFYGEAFDPAPFGIDNPFLFSHTASGTDSIYYFTPQDWNIDDLTLPDGIRKRFPNAPKPSEAPSEWNEFDTTSEGNLKFYEYEYVFRDIAPSIPLYISVSAFDFGSPSTGLGSLESNPISNAIREYPMASVGEVEEKGLRVIVYPNPYRADGQYRELGYEGRGDEELPRFKVRALNFTNLPPKCVIRIFSLDGDLIGIVGHNFGPDDPGAMHDSWNLITRNTQLAVSGIYYFTVEEPDGNIQMGKFALIM